MRRLSVLLAALAGGLVLATVGLGSAEEARVYILKIEGKRVTAEAVGKKGGTPHEMVFFLKDGVKVVRGTFNKETKKLEPGEAVEGGITNKIFSDKVSAQVVFDANRTISEIRVLGKKKV